MLAKLTSFEGDPIYVNAAQIVSLRGSINGGTTITTAVPNGDSPYRFTVGEDLKTVASIIENKLNYAAGRG